MSSGSSGSERIAITAMLLTLALVLSVLAILTLGQVSIMKDLPHDQATQTVDSQRERRDTRVYHLLPNQQRAPTSGLDIQVPVPEEGIPQ